MVNEAVPAAVGATLMVPLEGSAPLQAPPVLQLVPALAVQVRVTLCPRVIVVGVAVRVTTAGAGAPMTPTGPLPVLLPPQAAKIKAQTKPLTPIAIARFMSMLVPLSPHRRDLFCVCAGVGIKGCSANIASAHRCRAPAAAPAAGAAAAVWVSAGFRIGCCGVVSASDLLAARH